MKSKVTILTGAGFTVTPEFGGPKTLDLTNKIRNLNIPEYIINGKTPGEYFYRKLCFHYTKKKKHDCDLSIVNFETIIHLLEEVYSHLSYINNPEVDNNSSYLLNSISKFKGVKQSFVTLKKTISKDLKSLLTTKDNSTLNQIVREIYSRFIQAIIDELKKINSESKNIGMRKFETKFLKRNLPERKYIRRFYTLNYDTWLNKYLQFYDGFDANGNFNSDKVMKQIDIDCHYNLHGSILWKNDLQINRMLKIQNPVDYLSYIQSSEYGSRRESLIATPIITGYNKSERMKFPPFLQFYYSLQTDILNSDLLILIGYSFSDTHINNIISLFKGRCIIIGFAKSWIDEMKEITNLSGKSIADRNILFNQWDNEISTFIKSIEPNDGGFELSKQDIINGWITSKNGNTKYWWKGIGDEFYKNWARIIL